MGARQWRQLLLAFLAVELWTCSKCSAAVLRGLRRPHAAEDEVALVERKGTMSDRLHDIWDTEEDDTGSEADGELEKMELNNLLGYSDEQAEEQEQKELEEKIGSAEVEDDDDESAAL